MRSKQMRTGALLVGAVLFLLAIPSALGVFRPDQGYRRKLAAWIAPRQAEVELADILRRKADFIVDFYGFRYRGNTGNFIDAHVYYYGAFERPELYFVRDTLASLPANPVLIDVGANTGLYSAFTSKFAAQVHAFEPFPPILRRLNSLIADNGISNIVVHPMGLGATEAELPFFSPPEGNLGTGSFVSGFKRFQPENRDEHLTLQIVTGDVYFPKAGITRIDFIKMDIEGYEKSAVAGLRETLQRHRPILLMETSIDPAVPDLFKSMEELRSAFPESYDFFQMAGQNNLTGAYYLQPFHSSFDRQDQSNVVALPTEKVSIVPRKFDGDSAQANR